MLVSAFVTAKKEKGRKSYWGMCKSGDDDFELFSATKTNCEEERYLDVSSVVKKYFTTCWVSRSIPRNKAIKIFTIWIVILRIYHRIYTPLCERYSVICERYSVSLQHIVWHEINLFFAPRFESLTLNKNVNQTLLLHSLFFVNNCPQWKKKDLPWNRMDFRRKNVKPPIERISKHIQDYRTSLLFVRLTKICYMIVE